MIATNQIAGYVALLFFLAGSILLHLRLRNFLSLSFIASTAAILIWAFWASGALHDAFYAPLTHDAQDMIAMRRFHSTIAAVEAVLMIWFGASFLLAARSVRSQHVA